MSGNGKKAFGKLQKVQGRSVSADSTLVPVEFMRVYKPRNPIQATHTTSKFTIDAGTTHRIPIWNGNDIIFLDEAMSYTWAASANPILTSAGVETTQAGPAAGIWYYYVAQTDAGVYSMRASATGPGEVQGPRSAGPFTHPGLSATRVWTYVGFGTSSATTPTMVASTKVGFAWCFAARSVATATTWAELAHTGAKAIPLLAKLGGSIAGYIETGAAGSVTVGYATAGQGVQVVNTTTTSIAVAPFSMTMNENGKVYAQDTTARGDVHITQVVDCV